jgi:hypothetical protein
MTDVIQRNAGHIVALSMLLFTKAVAVTDNKSLTPLSGPPQDALLFQPLSHEIVPKLLTA